MASAGVVVLFSRRASLIQLAFRNGILNHTPPLRDQMSLPPNNNVNHITSKRSLIICQDENIVTIINDSGCKTIVFRTAHGFILSEIDEINDFNPKLAVDTTLLYYMGKMSAFVDIQIAQAENIYRELNQLKSAW